jgi:hypothetical protein
MNYPGEGNSLVMVVSKVVSKVVSDGTDGKFRVV